MEKKTIGGFIAALRRAEGMTQKELAERLNVSDKSVSRWERDEGAPDLSLIPVIAEIFNVSCDELLRGERRSPDMRGDSDTPTTQKGEKQLKHMLSAAAFKYNTRSYISCGIACVGIIAAMICNLAFLRGQLGFLIAIIFYLAAAIMQAIFINGAMYAVSGGEVDDDALAQFRHTVFITAKRVYMLIALLIFICMPLITATGGAYFGLDLPYWLLFGALWTIPAYFICSLIAGYVYTRLIKAGRFALTQAEADAITQKFSLQRGCTIAVCVLVSVTAFFQFLVNEMGAGTFVSGTTFYDYESFVEYMETYVPYDGSSDYESLAPDSAVAPLPIEPTDAQYFDEYGNEITKDEAYTSKLSDINGNVVCTYIKRNESVAQLSYRPTDGSALPVTVKTYDNMREGEQTLQYINIGFIALYIVEILGVCIFYSVKRRSAR